ncbi:hypothetical protein [Escherichia phage UPEC06]|nr:hypothetical protein [Escherichia phage UPEC06]
MKVKILESKTKLLEQLKYYGVQKDSILFVTKESASGTIIANKGKDYQFMLLKDEYEIVEE